MKSDDINSLLSRIAVAHGIINEKLMCDVGLHAGQAQILVALWEEDAQSQADLVKRLCVSPPTVNKMVAKLTESGFVTCGKSETDKRLMLVRLTAKGARVQSRVETQLERLKSILLKDFSKTERVLLPILLEKLRQNLQIDLSEI